MRRIEIGTAARNRPNLSIWRAGAALSAEIRAPMRSECRMRTPNEKRGAWPDMRAVCRGRLSFPAIIRRQCAKPVQS
jgi:hypothetical protein